MSPMHNSSFSYSNHSPVRAASKRKAGVITNSDIKPLRQGALDSLCGIYAIVNAFRLLSPELDIAASHHLFRFLLAPKHNCGPKPLEILRSGMTTRDNRKLIKLAKKFMKAEFGIGFKITKISRKQRHSLNTPDHLLHLIACALLQDIVPIIGLEGRRSHWTIIQSITASEIRLFDSNKITVLKRANCSIEEEPSRDCILPHEVTFIERITR